MEAPDCSEVALVTLGVRDLEATARFYQDVFGYVTLEDGLLPPVDAAAWGLPEASVARYTVVGRPGARRGLLRLVAFDRPGEHIWGRYERIQDHGHYALNFRVADLEEAWPRLLRAGVRPKSAPTYWNLDETMSVWDSQSWDIDGTLLDVYQMEGRPEIFPPLGGDLATEVEAVAIHVASADRSRAFYTALGFQLFFDKTLENLGAFLHMPAGVALRDVNLYKLDRSPVGRIEIVELMGFPGRQVAPRARAPNHGILSISFIVRDLRSVAEALREAGGEAARPPYLTVAPVFGAAHALQARGPDGEALEFLQPLAATG